MRWFARSEVICWVFVESSIAAEAHETFAEAAGDRVLACLLCPVCRNLRISLQKRMAQPQKFLCCGDVPYPARQHFHCDRLRELTAKVWETFQYDDEREDRSPTWRVLPRAVRVPRISATLVRLAGLNQAAICW
jgi:hypothetical protein